MVNRIFFLLVSLTALLIITVATTIALFLQPFHARFFTPAEARSTVTLIAVGDIMTSRMVARQIIKPPTENYPFTHIQDYLATADIIFANLETPVVEGDMVSTTTMQFRSDPVVATLLHAANISLVSLANNHMHDYKKKGLMRTVELMKENGIQAAGAGVNTHDAYAPVYVEKNGITVALLAYIDPGLAPANAYPTDTLPGVAVMNMDKLRDGILEAKKHADVVIVSMHGGREYTREPTATQKNFAYAAIDDGADIVLGHHPHWVQTVEEYKGKTIFYSLGNFVFDQLWSKETRNGLTAKITMTKEGITQVEQIPIYIDETYQPTIVQMDN
ncbi:MAG: hypothetical protein JWM56_660 [Candidatus Peribacteria bacterium]|nr:hypothetical protein [Candidatus Peribacteria bacterium]